MAAGTLSERVTKLSAALPSVALELQLALDKATADPKESLSKSRLALERAIKELAAFEEIQPKGKNPGDLLQDKRFRALVPVEIHAEMQYTYTIASEYGPHPGVPSDGLAVTILERLCKILDWYTTEYVGSGLVDNFGNLVNKEDKLVLYVSSGGTDRCAMANVITRHYLEGRETDRHIHPMSVALHKLTGETMSSEAAELLLKEFGKDVSEHRSIRGNERHWRRAQLVLAMEDKLREQLPSATGGKSELFSTFYGGSGDITDPFKKGEEVYRRVFEVIHPAIRDHIENLIRRLDKPLA